MTRKSLVFLPAVSLNEIQKLYQKEKDSKAKVRLLCAMQRKKGKTFQFISENIGLPLMTVSDAIKRFNERGLGGRYNIKQTGRPSDLTKEQEKEVKKILNQSPEKEDLPFRFWTTKLLMHVIEKKYGVSYKQRNMQRLVQTWNFSFKKARPEHKFADEKEQEDFKKNFQKRFNLMFGLDGRYSILTKVSSQ